MHNIYTANVDNSTLNDVIDEDANRWRRVVSWVVLLVVALLVVAALLHVFEQSSSVQAKNAQGSVEASYPLLSQAGNEIELKLLLSASSELPATATVAVNREYLLLFEDLAIYPEPDAQTSDAAGTVEFEFATQPGSTQTSVLFVGRASDQWELRTAGRIDATWDGGGSYSIPVSTWRIP